MAVVIPFPGVDPAKIRPRPTCLADLPEGAKALVVIPERRGFAVVVRPCRTASENFERRSFASAVSALQFARNLAIREPRRFQLIIDETGRRSLDDVMGTGPGDAA